ncbi:MAG: hypothetical protein ACE5KV_08885 [Thermoplasmata archaeon]
MRENVWDFAYKVLVILGGAFGAIGTILYTVDSIARLGWEVELLVIALLSLGCVILVLVSAFLFREKRRLEMASRRKSSRHVRTLVSRDFELIDAENQEIARIRLKKGQEIEFHVDRIRNVRLFVQGPPPLKPKVVPHIAGHYSEIFFVPVTGDWVFLIKDKRSQEEIDRAKKSYVSSRKDGGLRVFHIYTRD